MEETRNTLRKMAQARRRALTPQTWLRWSRLIQASALERPQYLAATSVALYSPVDNEVDTRTIMKHALRSRKKVFYPRLRESDVPAFVRIHSGDDFICGAHGVPEPIGNIRLTEKDCGSLVVLVPGLVFDRRGYRLGRGGGWYDRALLWLGVGVCSLGLAYEFQIVDRLPERSWDQKVDYVLTESSVIRCGHALQPEF